MRKGQELRSWFWKPQTRARESANHGGESRYEHREVVELSRLAPGAVMPLLSVFSMPGWVRYEWGTQDLGPIHSKVQLSIKCQANASSISLGRCCCGIGTEHWMVTFSNASLYYYPQKQTAWLIVKSVRSCDDLYAHDDDLRPMDLGT